MSLWRHLSSGLRRLTHRSAAEQEVVDEVEHLFESALTAHLERGATRAEAERRVRLELGSPTAVREEVRGYGWESLVEQIGAELRYAMRRLWAARLFTAVTTATLALGIGITAAIFGAIRPILLAPLPYPHSDRIVALWNRDDQGHVIDVTFGSIRELAERSRAFDALAMIKPWRPAWQSGERPERIAGQQVSAHYFDVLATAPALGSDFDPADDRPGGTPVVMLSDRFWRHRLGGDPAVVGKPVELEGLHYQVLGIMPADFENLTAPDTEVWTLLRYDLSEGRAWGHHLHAIGRLNAATTMRLVRQELDRIAGDPIADFPRPAWAALENGFLVRSLQEELGHDVRPALIALFVAAALLLAIATVNVTNLAIARALGQSRELSLRIALGAPRLRLVRQQLIESLLLALGGGLVALLVADLTLRALVALSPAELPRSAAMRTDWWMLGFVLALSLLTGLALGFAQALRSRREPRCDLRDALRPAAVGAHRSRGALVVAQVAMALVLLIGSGLLLRSLQNLFAVSPGFDPSNLLAMSIEVAGDRFAEDAATYAYFDQVLAAARRLPGVRSATLTNLLPLTGDSDRWGIQLEPSPPIDPNAPRTRGLFRYAVAPGYFETMGIPLRSGRLFEESDRDGAQRVAVISESLAREQFEGDPIGQRLRIGSGPLYAVVGVVADVRQVSLALDEGAAIYTPSRQWRWADAAMTLAVRTDGDPATLAPALRASIWSVDDRQPIVRVATMEELAVATEAKRRFALTVLGAFALAALLLAATGLYGVLASRVAERRTEIAVRMAVGAARKAIVVQIVRQGLALVTLGCVLGLGGAALVSRLLSSLLFEVAADDPSTFAGVVALFLVVGVLACCGPAWRAARVDPTRTLRS